MGGNIVQTFRKVVAARYNLSAAYDNGTYGNLTCRKRLVRLPLRAEVYLDKDGKSVIATVRFTGIFPSALIIAVTIVTPADGPSFGTAPSGK